MRVYEIAKELGLHSKDVLALLEKHGISLPSHMSVLSDKALELLKKPIPSQKQAPSPIKKIAVKSEEVKTVSEPLSPVKKNENYNIPPSGVVAPVRESKEAAVLQSNEQLNSTKGAVRLQSTAETRSTTGIKGYRVEDDEQLRYQLENEEVTEEAPLKNEKISLLLQRKGLIIERRPTRKRGRRRRGRMPATVQEAPVVTEITLSKSLPLHEAAVLLGKSAGDIISALLKRGMVCNRNYVLSVDIIESLAQQFGVEIVKQDESPVNQSESLLAKKQSLEHATGEFRWPIAVVMGHVDHGKTTFLDYIRKMKVAASEKGGITQHLGAYEVDSAHGKIIFLDTPGHEAFATIRQRGARVTDIAILIVAADDGVKPQTVEAIRHAQEAGVPIIVALNKIDKAPSQAALDTIKRQLSQHDLLAEDWGGQVVMVPISAKTGQGVDELLQMIVLQSQLMDLRAHAQAPARAYVLESRLEKGYGPVATIICTEGTLHQGDFFVCGDSTGKVRLLINSHGQKVKQAAPSIPVQVVGFDSVASIGEWLKVIPAAEYNKIRSSKSTATKAALENPQQRSFEVITEKVKKEINIVLKTDTRGSQDAMVHSLDKLLSKHKAIKCPINIIQSGIGDVSEGDIDLASNTKSILIALHVKVEKNAMQLARKLEVEVWTHDIIYRVIEDLEKLLLSKREAVISWVKCGEANVKKVFDIKGVGVIAGCYIKEGTFGRNCKVVCMRGGQKVGEGKINSLQRDKKPVKEVHAGFDCGFSADSFQDWVEDDIAICYNEVREKLQ
ncbi:translation initiation factor IF-2 [Candidatus Dependentiae bacterium]|jgi:translation initiation factor IF-2|nr:translation initiation factor IF-2 [Candidatus Dependentiae bacterium]